MKVGVWDKHAACVSVSLPIFPRERLGKDVTAATNTRATVEELTTPGDNYVLWRYNYVVYIHNDVRHDKCHKYNEQQF
jgi:hypothetical protein